MKKAIILLLSIVLSLSLCAAAETYPSGWYSLGNTDGDILSLFYLPDGCDVSLPDAISLAPIEDSVSFTASPGIYTVGVDFPAGVYSVRCADGESLFNIIVKNEKGSSVFSDGFWADKGEYLGKIELLDGYSVSIDQGKAYFSAPGGIVFD